MQLIRKIYIPSFVAIGNFGNSVHRTVFNIRPRLNKQITIFDNVFGSTLTSLLVNTPENCKIFFGKCKTKKEIILTLNLNPKCCSMAPEMKLFSRDEDHHRQQLSSLLIFCRFFCCCLAHNKKQTKKNLNNPR